MESCSPSSCEGECSADAESEDLLRRRIMENLVESISAILAVL